MHPNISQRFECFTAGHVKYIDNPMGTPIVRYIKAEKRVRDAYWSNPYKKMHAQLVRVLNLSCPAVSQIVNFVFLPLTVIILALKSTPIVA